MEDAEVVRLRVLSPWPMKNAGPFPVETTNSVKLLARQLSAMGKEELTDSSELTGASKLAWPVLRRVERP